MRSYLKYTHHKKGMVEWLKVKVLSSSPSSTKKKKKEKKRKWQSPAYLHHSWLDSIQVNLQPHKVSSACHLTWRVPHNAVLLVGRLHLPSTKLVAIKEGSIWPLPSTGGAECWTDPVCVVVGQSSCSLVKTTPHSITLKKLVVSWNWQTSKRKVVDQKAQF
jgi:hypothetical protein